MLDTTKFYEFFKPETCRDEIHIIGCGAVGSTIAELLVRMGLTKFTLYDYDIVEPHNIANQMFRHTDIGKPKTEALADIMREINPDVQITIEDKYEDQMLDGYVFMAVDKIAIRKQIVNNNYTNLNIKALFDTRIRLTDAQGFGVVWDEEKQKKQFLNTMNFTDEEAEADTPVSACNIALSVAPTVRLICTYIVADFINLLQNNGDFKQMILLQHAFKFEAEAF